MPFHRDSFKFIVDGNAKAIAPARYRPPVPQSPAPPPSLSHDCPRLPAGPSVSSAPATSPASPVTSAALMLRIAGRPGPSFVLDASGDNTLGRSPDAFIVVADRLASRAHASLRFEPGRGGWVLRDLGSRNGTWLDGAPVESAVLADGAVVRVGTSELVFKHIAVNARPIGGETPATAAAAPRDDGGRLVRCGPVAQLEGSVLRRSAIGSTDDARRPLLLYQASIRLLTSRSVREVIGTTLELAATHSGASSVGWFHVGAAERLEPACVVPPGSRLAEVLGERLGDATCRLIAREGNAVWAGQPASPHHGGDGDAEIACVPLLEENRVHAVLAAAAPPGALRTADFDFLVALASLASAACAGHSIQAAGHSPGATPGRRPPEARDLASLQTVELDEESLRSDDADDRSEVLPPEASLPDGTLVLNRVSLQQLVLSAEDASPAAARIDSFVSETATLKLDDWQRVLVIEALRRTGGSVPNAAAELGISRATLYRKLEQYGLARSR